MRVLAHWLMSNNTCEISFVSVHMHTDSRESFEFRHPRRQFVVCVGKLITHEFVTLQNNRNTAFIN